MLILTIRTDNPKAELGLYHGDRRLNYQTWQAHRLLAESIHIKIAEILKTSGINLSEINGIVVYQGPGSFTGLRIGISVANALAYGLDVPIAGSTGAKWQQAAAKKLISDPKNLPIVPDYRQDPHITKQKK